MVQLLRLGKFRFTVPTVSYDTFVKKLSAGWTRQKKYRSDNSQHFSGMESIEGTLSGSIYTELDLAGGPIGTIQLNNLIQMMRVGKSYSLVTGTGANLGKWIIKDLEITETVHYSNGVPRKQSFILNIEQDMQSTKNVKDTFLNRAGDFVTINVGR